MSGRRPKWKQPALVDLSRSDSDETSDPFSDKDEANMDSLLDDFGDLPGEGATLSTALPQIRRMELPRNGLRFRPNKRKTSDTGTASSIQTQTNSNEVPNLPTKKKKRRKPNAPKKQPDKNDTSGKVQNANPVAGNTKASGKQNGSNPKQDTGPNANLSNQKHRPVNGGQKNPMARAKNGAPVPDPRKRPAARARSPSGPRAARTEVVRPADPRLSRPNLDQPTDPRLARIEFEREMRIRRHELDTFAAAQSKRQRELDAKTASTVSREKELQKLSKDVDTKIAALKKSALEKKEELSAIRKKNASDCEARNRKLRELQDQIQKEREQLDTERNDFLKRSTAREQELEKNQQLFRHECLEKEKSIASQRVEMEQILNDQRNKLKEEKLALQVERENYSATVTETTLKIERQRAELDQQRNSFDARVKTMEKREKALKSMKAKVKAKHTKKEEELASSRRELDTERETLRQSQAVLETAVSEHISEKRQWREKVVFEKEQTQRRLQSVEAEHAKKELELNERSAGLDARHTELERRASVQRRRATELRTLKRQIDASREQSDALHDTVDADATVTAATVPPPRTFSDQREASRSSPTSSGNSRMPDGGQQFVLVDSDEEGEEVSRKQSAASVKQHPPMPFDYEKNYNSYMTNETAEEIQDRLFREAAERMKREAAAQTTRQASFSSPNQGPAISEPVFDVATRFPYHWKWKEPYSVLGLPPNSSVKLVKSQYRRLAKVYHPDKSSRQDTSTKFHCVTVAYQKLIPHHN